MKKHMSKKLIMAIRIACIGSAVLGIGGMQNVFAYSQDLNPIGYQADGGTITSHYSTVHVHQDGTVEWEDSPGYPEDNAENDGNVAIGNFSKAGSLNDKNIIGNMYVTRESPTGTTSDYFQYVKQGDKYYKVGYYDPQGNLQGYLLDAKLNVIPDSTPVALNLAGNITNNVAIGNHATTKSSSSVAIGDDSQSQGAIVALLSGQTARLEIQPTVPITMMAFRLLLLVMVPKRWGMAVLPRDKIHMPTGMRPSHPV